MRQIKADINSVKGKLNRYFSECIGAGRAAEVMRHAAYEQLCTLQRESHFNYIRFHGLFHDEMAVAYRAADGKIRYNFQYVDLLFDSLLDAEIRPVVELGLMPEALAATQERVFWWQMNKSMPKEMSEWYDLVYETVKHFTARYGECEVKKWYFEVWNEPNLAGFFTDSDKPESYFRLYDAAARAVKAVCADYRVGGPATAGPNWIDELLVYCKEHSTPIDFISAHQYGVEGAFDENGTRLTRIKPINYIIDIIKDAGDKCHKMGLPLLMTEWSTSYSCRDPIHDSYYSSAYILEVIKRCEGYADMLSYWVYTDIFEEVEPAKTMFHGGFGLFTVRSVPKPSYHTYRMLASLADTELNSTDPSSYICKDDEKLQILFWNNATPDIGDEVNLKYFKKPLPAAKLEDATVEIAGLEPGKSYEVTLESIGYRMGDCYNAFLDGGYGEHLTREETAELIEKSKPKKVSYTKSADACGTLVLTVAQSENQSDMITVSL